MSAPGFLQELGLEGTWEPYAKHDRIRNESLERDTHCVGLRTKKHSSVDAKSYREPHEIQSRCRIDLDQREVVEAVLMVI